MGNAKFTRSFKNLDLKPRYGSMDDALNEFYIPVLSNSKNYYRVTGYFSSSVLVAIARGLSHFVKHGEKMYLITGIILSEEDIMAIIKGKITPAEILERKLMQELRSINFENLVMRKRLEVLAWLVATGRLDIKIAFPNLDEVTEKNVKEVSLFHSKFAIFEDFEGNMIQIEGSINETEAAWLKNTESFSVHRSWVEHEKIYVENALEEFKFSWNNKNPKVRTYEVPDAVKKELIKIASKKLFLKVSTDVDLWPHQKDAIKEWYAHNLKGIFSMATGSGKTLTALYAIKRCEKNPFVVLLVPTFELIEQWTTEIKKAFGDDCAVYKVSSKNPNWKNELGSFIWAYMNDKNKKFIISTIRSASSKVFIDVINHNLQSNYILIVDEVHRLGARKSRIIMKELNPEIGRLGLSATPKRIWDDIGTNMILDYFGGIIYEYTLKDAIRDGRIVPYEYHIEYVYLTNDELEKYKEVSAKIMREYIKLISNYKLPSDTPIYKLFSYLSDEKDLTRVDRLLLKRAKIIKKAENKINKVIEIINNNKNKLNKCLIYCEDKQQLEQLAIEMSKKGYKNVKYLGMHDKDQRMEHLKLFKEGAIQFILSIKCLDEGINIPSADSAILVSSSRNPREFVQRRGRILRIDENKDLAIIYDLLVLPYPPENLWRLNRAELQIIMRELERCMIFLENAVNSYDSLLKVSDVYSAIGRVEKDNIEEEGGVYAL